MNTKTPIILDGNAFRPLANGEVLPGSALQISSDSGNVLVLGSDGGLATFDQQSGYANTGWAWQDFPQSAWVAAGSPNTWTLGDVTLQIPDSLLSRRCLCSVQFGLGVTGTGQSADSISTSGPRSSGISIFPMFEMAGLPAGNFYTGMTNPSPVWGFYVVNADAKQLPSGATLAVNRVLNNVNFTSQFGSFRVITTVTLMPLG